MSALTAIETDLLAALRAGFADTALVEALPALDPAELMQLFARRAPAIYITPGPVDVDQEAATVRWEVLIVASLAGGQRQARHGKAGAVGAYDLAWSVLALTGNGVATCHSTLYLRRLVWLAGEAGRQLADKGVICASGLLEGRVELPSAVDPDLLDALGMVRVDLDIQPFASSEDHQALVEDIVIEGLPDARDDISLEAP